MLTAASESQRDSRNVSDIYEVNYEDEPYIQDVREVVITNPLDPADYANRKLSDDGRLQLLNISPPCNLEYPLTNGRRNLKWIKSWPWVCYSVKKIAYSVCGVCDSVLVRVNKESPFISGAFNK